MRSLPRHAVLLWLLFTPLAHIAAAAGPPVRAEPVGEPIGDPVGDPVGEVVVESTRTKLNEMLQQMVQLEDHFFERYNELNTNDDFDVHCFQEARIGTRLKRRYCRAVYMRRALETEGQEYALFLLNNQPTPQQPGQPPPPTPPVMGGPPVPAIMTIEARRKDYQKNLANIARRDPELIRLLRERFELGKRYDTARRNAPDPSQPDSPSPKP